MARCAGINRRGSRCKSQAMPELEHCYYHAPELAQQRETNNRRGGKAAGRGRPARNELADVKAELRSLMEEVKAGEVDRADANCIAYLASTWSKLVEVERKVREVEELAEEIEEIKRAQRTQAHHGRFAR